MAFEWIKSFKRMERDPKTLHFKTLMRWSQSETIGFLHRFWWWADDVATDGNVTSLCLPGVVGGALGYSSDIGDKAVEKMQESGWLDVLDSGEIMIHNVERYRATSREQREKGRERVRKHRENIVKRDGNAPVTRYKKGVTRYKQNVTPLDEEEDEDIEKETTTDLPQNNEKPPSCSAPPGAKKSMVKKPKVTIADTGFIVPDAIRQAWAAAYPGVDIDHEAAKAFAWCQNNPRKAPKKDYGRFLNSWLGRADPEDSEKQAASAKAKTVEELDAEAIECERRVAGIPDWSPEGIAERVADDSD
jgi:hypothetical protein